MYTIKRKVATAQSLYHLFKNISINFIVELVGALAARFSNNIIQTFWNFYSVL